MRVPLPPRVLLPTLLILLLFGSKSCWVGALPRIRSAGSRSRLAISAPATSTTSTDMTWSMRGGGPSTPQKTRVPTKRQTREKLFGGTATIPAEVFNLIKLIVGAGALGLPAGVAAFADHPSALVPAVCLTTVIGGLAAYGFYLIGAVCAATQATSYKTAWAATVGQHTSRIPTTACLLVTCCSVLTNAMIQADALPAIWKSIAGPTAPTLGRNTALVGVTTCVLLPLCLLRSLSALAPFSLLGIAGMAYTCAAMIYRWLSGTYSILGSSAETNSALVQNLAAEFRPSFGTKGWHAVASPNVAILIAMLSSSFMAHYNAPRMYWELRNNTLPRFRTVVAASYAGAVLLMASVTLAGFGTFGKGSASMILNNYAASDRLMSFSKMAVTLSLLFTFPLAFLGVREGVMDLLSIPQARRAQISDYLTVGLLVMVTGLAMVLKDIRHILSLGGATWGNCVIYIFPALMVVKGAKKYPQLQCLVPSATMNGILGLILGVVGTTRAIQSMK